VEQLFDVVSRDFGWVSCIEFPFNRLVLDSYVDTFAASDLAGCMMLADCISGIKYFYCALDPANRD
jgi:hypothetical protein